MSTWESLSDILGEIPDLTGAACVGLGRLFDRILDDDIAEPVALRRERHAQAIAVCNVCPALQACRDWASTLKPAELPGVLAREIRPVKNIKKGAAA